MNWQPVHSSMISAIGYDAATHQLGVRLTNGRAYAYSGVSPGEHEAFLLSGSKGQHYNKRIKTRYAGRAL